MTWVAEIPKDWPLVVPAFAGGLLFMVFNTRLFIRVYQQMHAWGRTSKWDPFVDLIVPIRLRGTWFIDAVVAFVGWMLGIACMHVAQIAQKEGWW